MAHVDGDEYKGFVNMLSGELSKLRGKCGNSEASNIPTSESTNKRIPDRPIIRTKRSGKTWNFGKETSNGEHKCTRCGGSGHNNRSCTSA